MLSAPLPARLVGEWLREALALIVVLPGSSLPRLGAAADSTGSWGAVDASPGCGAAAKPPLPWPWRALASHRTVEQNSTNSAGLECAQLRFLHGWLGNGSAKLWRFVARISLLVDCFSP
ncbi:hypothetical protein ZEAMMB73_Zm00001d030980 [Zea mays]|uniref:Uncharacterized protein n=1 Tax=Zea mays TaxID=4577 RepID=A0A1D6KFG1_MAIZE|nr:hypothetical protein ZEAMMB73_Zm00001d030980 [Zea mays]